MASKKLEYAKLLIEYKKAAKLADQHMRSLKSFSYRPGFEKVTQFAYAKAVYKIRNKWGGNERWDTKPPKTLQGLRAKINDIKDFLNAPTSSRRKIMKIYKKRADTLNKRLNKDRSDGQRVNFTWDQLAEFWRSPEYAKLKDSEFWANSDLVLEVVSMLTHRKSKKQYEAREKLRADLDKRMDKFIQNNASFFDIVDDTAKQIELYLQKNNLSLERLYR